MNPERPEQRGKADPQERVGALRQARSLEHLRRLLEGLEGRRPKREERLISIATINVLPQPRKTLENIPLLASDIARNGLLTPLLVVRLREADGQEYLDSINDYWGTNFTTADLTRFTEPDGEFFDILIAGERRLAAIKFLKAGGCPTEEHQGRDCFEEHFPGGEVKVDLAVDISPIQAHFLQFSENTHMRVLPHEEARALHHLFFLVRRADEKFPLAKFARLASRSEGTVRDALKFCGLPLNIQTRVEKGYLSYSKAVEIARLQDAGLTGEELEGWANRAMTERKSTVEFRKMVTNHLTYLTSGQVPLFSKENLEALMRQASTRRVVSKETIMILWGGIAYLRRVMKMLEDGTLGQKESPFSTKSPVRVYRAFVGQLAQTLPLLSGHLPEKKVAEAEEVIRQASAALAALEAELPEGTENLDPYSSALAGGQENNQ